MEDEVVVVANQLAAAVELTMDPEVPQGRRAEAYTACESFKEKSPLCVQCGLYLARQPQFSQFVRHFGLQLMEHCVKYRWYSMVQAEKVFIKENAMKMVEDRMGSMLEEQAHMKDALSRVVVEMIKREWPQQWPTLLSELSAVAERGDTQTELVLLIFLRLVEDVAVLQTLDINQRRKEIYHALSTNMPNIFTFFVNLIQTHCGHFHSYSSSNPELAKKHARVVETVLITLCGFVEWVSMSNIMLENGRLLHMLCILLQNEPFQSLAAECLVQIVSRKGKVEERRSLMCLFSNGAMSCIFQSADTSNKTLDDKHYIFLKKLTQVLTGLGMQLCSVWGKDFGQPESFATYLEAILTFSRHPSLTLAYYASMLWSAFFRHDLISRDPVFLSFLPKWLQATAPKTFKIAFPCRGGPFTDTAETYIALDYDSEEEFNAFFHRCRVEFLDTIKQATLVSPLVTYSYVQEWLTVVVQKTLTTTEPSTLQSPLFIEWEALTLVMDSVLKCIVQCNERPEVVSGLQLMDICLGFKTDDPLILSTLLSCISALFVFLSMAPPEVTAVYLPRVLDKIFATLVFEVEGETKGGRSRPVRNLRRHAASLMVKIASKYPLLLLPVFGHIHSIVQGLESNPHTLSKMEAITLQEALLLISNHFCEYERQCSFVREVVAGIATQWEVMAAKAFCGPVEFTAFVGLSLPPMEPGCQDQQGQNRAQIVHCVNILMALVKRVQWPDDPDHAARGGFVQDKCPDTGNPVYRSPAAPHFLPLLPGLLSLLKVCNALWTPQAQQLISPGYSGANAMLETDRCNLLGGPPSNAAGERSCDTYSDAPRTGLTPLTRMQNFLSNVHDQCYHALGNAFPALGRDLYQLPNLAGTLVHTVLSNVEYIADYRLRMVVRVFFKQFIAACPIAFYNSVLLPVLSHFMPYMFLRLSASWQQAELRQTEDEEKPDPQEMIDDMLHRTLTREYMDIIKVVLVGSSLEAGPCGGMEEDYSAANNRQCSETISELGVRAMRNGEICQAITLCLLRALSWNDSTASLKATTLLGPVIRQLIADNSLSPQLAAHTITSVLQGLQQHGQHDANQGQLLMLGTQFYDLMRPNFNEVCEVMQQIPEVNLTDLQKLDERILQPKEAVITNNKNKVDRAKKEMFKKVIQPLIGCNVGQLFRRKVWIKNLPPVLAIKKETPTLVEPSDGGISLPQLFSTS